MENNEEILKQIFSELMDKIKNIQDSETVKYFVFDYFRNSDLTAAQILKIGKMFSAHGEKELSKLLFLNGFLKNFENRDYLRESNHHIPKDEFDEYLLNSENAYRTIIEKSNDLAHDFKTNSALEVAILFVCLLWNGYYAKDFKHYYQKNNKFDIWNHYSYDIFNGSGVCLGYSDMLTDILKDGGYNASSMMCWVDKTMVLKSQEEEKLISIERNQKQPPLFHGIVGLALYPFAKNIGNHATVLINEKNSLYIYDPTNIAYFYLNDKYNATPLTGIGKMKLSPYMSYIIQKDNNKSSLDVLLSSDGVLSNPYSKDQYFEILRDEMNRLDDNIERLKEFHYEILPDILDVHENAVKIKKAVSKKKIMF